MIQKYQLRYLSKKTLKKTESNRQMHLHVHNCIIHNSQIMTQPKCPQTGGTWIKNYGNIGNGVLLGT